MTDGIAITGTKKFKGPPDWAKGDLWSIDNERTFWLPTCCVLNRNLMFFVFQNAIESPSMDINARINISNDEKPYD